MDGDLSQPTQPATQNVIDPRRVGKQNSGFTDEDIADIICLLIPYSINARNEAARLAREGSPYVIGHEEARNVDIDYTYEDYAGNFGLSRADPGSGPAFVLRLSAQVKDPLQGFTFGRNPNRCDVCFNNNSLRRLSNIHFRIFINEHGVLMLQDQSTNGTAVDEMLLKARRPGTSSKRTLNSGTKISILLQNVAHDLEFLVRVPRREGQYEAAYQRNLHTYLERLAMLADPDDESTTQQNIAAGRAGIVNLFPTPPNTAGVGGIARRLPPRFEPRTTESLPREWNGSSRYNRVGQIGKGAFATVHKVTAKFDGLPYAAKELDKRRFIKNGVLDQKVENEMRIMQKIHHPNIVRYIEHFDFDDRLLIIIMEYVPMGDLGSFITNRGSLPEATVKDIASQLIDALGYLHCENITHRDVKPDNILIESLSPFSVKLTDFGLSKMVDNEQTFLRTFCGTLLYCAPEVYGEYTEYDENGMRSNRPRKKTQTLGQRYDHAIDIWSLGGVLFYCLTARPPYPVKQGTTYMELLNWIMTRPLDVAPLRDANVSSQCIHFLSLMLQKRPETRASIEALQAHPWLAGPAAASTEALEQSASQLSIVDDDQRPDTRLDDFQSDDEILDDDMIDNESQTNDLRPAFSGPSPSLDDDLYAIAGLGQHLRQSPAETPGTPHGQPPRLFGEVNVSAIGSSGVIPEDRLNLPLSGLQSSVSEQPGSFSSDSGDSSRYDEALLTPRGRHLRPQQSQQGQQWSQPRAQQVSRESSNDGGRGGAHGNGGHAVLTPLSQAHDFEESHSVDELNNMTFDVASQSLGGAESILGNLNMKSLANVKHSITDFSSSKRKPAPDTSDEFESARPTDKPTIKRLKSEVRIASASGLNVDSDGAGNGAGNDRSEQAGNGASDVDDGAHEAEVYAAVKPVVYSKTGRQMDLPVPKSVYWTPGDPSTWNLHYPEMTQLQYDAFEVAADALGEDFRPGPSRLWRLAMKHFPPVSAAASRSASEPQSRSRSASHLSDTAVLGNGGGDNGDDGNNSSDHKENIVPHTVAGTTAVAVSPPKSAPPHEVASAPYVGHPTARVSSQQQPPHAQIVVPVVAKQGSVAHLKSVHESVVRNIYVPITESITSWGRHPDNTLVFTPRTELKVPKLAFKILLWRSDGRGGTGSEPWKDLQPWRKWNGEGEAASRYHFYISTKARGGILINGTLVNSSDPGNTDSASRNWARLHDGDSVVVWHNTGSDTKAQKTELVFRCTWGGSAKARSALPPSLATVNLADEPTSRRLDEACSRAQLFLTQRKQQQQWLPAVSSDVAERMQRIDAERLRSVDFEKKRADILAASGHYQQQQQQQQQRASRPRLPLLPASAPAVSAPLVRDGTTSGGTKDSGVDYVGSSSVTPTPSVAVAAQRPGDRLPRQ